MKQLEQVKTFMTTFGQPVLDTPTIPSADRIELRRRLSQEELDEFTVAAAAGDIVEVADALTDRLYVLLGDYLEFGLGGLLEVLFDEVQASNMSKLDKDGKVLYREDGKILKSDQFFKPDLKTIVEHYIFLGGNPHMRKAERVPETQVVAALTHAMKKQDGRSNPGQFDHHQLRMLLDAGHISFKDYLSVVANA